MWWKTIALSFLAIPGVEGLLIALGVNVYDHLKREEIADHRHRKPKTANVRRALPVQKTPIQQPASEKKLAPDWFQERMFNEMMARENASLRTPDINEHYCFGIGDLVSDEVKAEAQSTSDDREWLQQIRPPRIGGL